MREGELFADVDCQHVVDTVVVVNEQRNRVREREQVIPSLLACPPLVYCIQLTPKQHCTPPPIINTSFPPLPSLPCCIHYIGMHNEFVGTRAPRAAAFVCFKAAEQGGEFLIADGRKMFRDLSPSLVEELYNRGIRYSVMELPFFGWVDNLPGFLQEPVMGALKGAASAAINSKVDFDVELRWGQAGYDDTKMLQARAPSQPPIVLHPVTGEPTWFCNVHSHSSVLRKEREGL